MKIKLLYKDRNKFKKLKSLYKWFLVLNNSLLLNKLYLKIWGGLVGKLYCIKYMYREIESNLFLSICMEIREVFKFICNI